MDQTEVFGIFIATVALTLCLHVFLLVEIRWHSKLLEELKQALLKQQGGAPPELAPVSPRVVRVVEMEAETEDSKDEWDRRLAERAVDRGTPTLPSESSRTLEETSEEEDESNEEVGRTGKLR